MKMKIFLSSSLCALFALAPGSAHTAWVSDGLSPLSMHDPAPAPTPPGRQRPPVGYVSGTLFISSLKSAVNLDCKNLSVEVRQVGGSQKLLSKATAYRNIAKKSCRYSIGAVRAGAAFQLIVIEPQELQGKCDQKKFVADGTLPITLKPGEKLVRDIAIREISCTIVK